MSGTIAPPIDPIDPALIAPTPPGAMGGVALTGLPRLESERLILRAPQPDDFAAMLAFNASPRAQFIGGGSPRQFVWRGLLANLGHWALRGYGFFSVIRRSDGAFIGRIGVIYHDGWPEPELAWHLYDGFEGQGYAYEAALMARADAARRCGLQRLMSMIDPANARSQALARRLGAVHEKSVAATAEIPAYDIWRHPEERAAS